MVMRRGCGYEERVHVVMRRGCGDGGWVWLYGVGC